MKPSQSQVKTEQELINKIEKLYANKEYEEVLNTYIDFSEINKPSNEFLTSLMDKVSGWLKEEEKPSIFRFRGLINSGLKEYQNAINDYNKAIEIKPKYEKAYNNRGNTYSYLKDYKSAILDYNKAIEIKPKYEKAYYNRGIIHAELKEYKKAINDYNKAIEIKPKYENAYNNRANIYSKLKDYKSAIEDYNKAIEINPKHENAYNNRGTTHHDLNQYDKAINDYNKVIEINPKHENAYNNRAIVHYDLNEYEKAINDYNNAIEINPKYENAYFNRGLAYKADNNLKKAHDDFLKVLELTHNQHIAEKAKWQIENIKSLLEDSNYKKINDAIEEIKEQLKYKTEEGQMLVTHYTGMTGATILLTYDKDKVRFRLSEGNFMNDTSEGELLRKAILMNNVPNKKKQFINKPFLGSFIPQSENHHDNLTLWRMYAKSANNKDGCGCSITIDGRKFLDRLEDHFSSGNGQVSHEDQLDFYRVAYLNSKYECIGKKKYAKIVTKKIREIRALIKKVHEDKHKDVLEKLSEIDYLFKGEEYSYENEVRLVIPERFKEEHIKLDDVVDDNIPPRVYMELVNIRPFIKSITIGPKVEKAEEWACVFSQKLKKEGNEDVDITISTLPYK